MHEEEARKQSVDEELKKMEMEQKSSWKSREEILEEAKKRGREATVGTLEGLVLAMLGSFIGFYYIIPSYDELSFFPYLLTILLIAALYGSYYGLKHLWMKRRRKE